MQTALGRKPGFSHTHSKKKLKDNSFVAKVDRGEVHAGAERLGVRLEEHIQLVIEALAPHPGALGISGTNQTSAESPLASRFMKGWESGR